LFGSQLVHSACHTSGTWQLPCVVTVQEPVTVLQQAAVTGGAGQLFGSQLAHSACHTLGARQLTSVATVQAPLGAQQAAVAG
jgi:hypothetical protein